KLALGTIARQVSVQGVDFFGAAVYRVTKFAAQALRRVANRGPSVCQGIVRSQSIQFSAVERVMDLFVGCSRINAKNMEGLGKKIKKGRAATVHFPAFGSNWIRRLTPRPE